MEILKSNLRCEYHSTYENKKTKKTLKKTHMKFKGVLRFSRISITDFLDHQEFSKIGT